MWRSKLAGLRGDLAPQPLDGLPIAARGRHEGGGPAGVGDHPAVLGLDRHRDRPLGRDDGVVPGPGQVLDARRAGQRQRGHDQQALGQPDLGGALEELAGDRRLAVGLEQAGLQREQDEAAPGRRGVPIVRASGRARRGPRRSGLRTRARWPATGRRAGRRRCRPGRATTRAAPTRWPARRAGARRPANARRCAIVAGEPWVRAAALPGPLEQPLGILEIAGEERQVRPDAVVRARSERAACARPAGARRRRRRSTGAPRWRRATSRSRSPGSAVIRLAASRYLTALVQAPRALPSRAASSSSACSSPSSAVTASTR